LPPAILRQRRPRSRKRADSRHSLTRSSRPPSKFRKPRSRWAWQDAGRKAEKTEKARKAKADADKAEADAETTTADRHAQELERGQQDMDLGAEKHEATISRMEQPQAQQ
jgi:hypothetical protein